jgi:hypothetical protein
MAPKAKQIYKKIQKQESKIAKKEVKKAKKMIKKHKKWTVAASALGYHAGYSSKKGMLFGKGGLFGRESKTEHVQTGVKVKQVPASNASIFTPYYNRKPSKNGLTVCGLQLVCNIGWDATASAGVFMFGGSGGTRATNFQINPDVFGGQMAYDARNYQYFKFKKIKLILIMPSTSISTPDSNTKICLAHFQDPRIGSFQTLSYSSLQNGNDAFNFQVVQPFGPLTWKLKQLGATQVKWLNTEQDATSSASDRMCCQGAIYGFYSSTVNATAGTIGDLLIEYELELKERSPDYGFTMQIGDKKLLREVGKVIEDYVSKDFKDSKDEKDINFYMKAYRSTMKHLKTVAEIGDQKFGSAAAPIVTIVDRTYNPSVPDTTLMASVSAGSMACGSGTGTQDVNIKQVHGATLGQNQLPVDIRLINGVTPTTSDGNIGIDVKKVASSTANFPLNVNVADASTTNAVAVNVKQAAGVNMSGNDGNITVDLLKINTTAVKGNADNGNKISGTLPVQIIGADADNTTNYVLAHSTAGTGSGAHSRLVAYEGTLASSTSTTCRSTSPTTSLNEEYIKVPKRLIKEQKDQKGPKGPSQSTDSDEEREITMALCAAKLQEMGVPDPEIDFSVKQSCPIKELARQVITDMVTADILQD